MKKISLTLFTSMLRRKSIAIVLFGTAFLVLALRLAFLSIWAPKKYGSIPIPAVERGSIYDRSGRLLAEQVKAYTISFWLPELYHSMAELPAEAQVAKLTEVAEAFSLLAMKSSQALLEQLSAQADSSIVMLAKNADITLRDQFLQVAKAQNIEGLKIENQYIRFYPNGSLASNLIGYVNADNHGGDGLEYTFEKILAPPSLGSNLHTALGNSIELTIDANLQGTVERLIKNAVITNNARSATALIANAKTGEILSYVSLPTFDSNLYNLSTDDERMNRPIAEAYEPGSVFKVFSLSSVYDLGLIDPEETFFCNGYYETVTSSGEVIRINCQGVHGEQTMAQVLANSCNVGSALIAERIDETRFYNYLRDYGFGVKTAAPFGGQTSGILAAPSFWSERSKPTLAIGQEVAASAMQMLQAALVISNRGQMIRPQIIKRIIAPDGTVIKQAEREVIREVIQAETAASMLEMLKKGVEKGIAWRTYIPGLEIAAKTGTSQIYDRQTGTYSDSDFIASTLAYVPANDPEYVIYVMLNRPLGSSYFGANVVAPIIKDIILSIIPNDGLNMAGLENYFFNEDLSITIPTYEDVNLEILPDFTGFTSKHQLLTYAKQIGVQIKFYGHSDDLKAQFPPPGTLISKNLTVALFFDDYLKEQAAVASKALAPPDDATIDRDHVDGNDDDDTATIITDAEAIAS